MIVRMNGYFPERISTHAVETTLVNQDVEDARAWTYQLEGHEVYVVSFPSVGPNGLTWAYDQTTGLWHKWLYRNNQNEYERHRGNCCAFFNQQVLVGDYENGKIYQLSPNFYTDDGDIIRRLRRAPHITSDLQRQISMSFRSNSSLVWDCLPAKGKTLKPCCAGPRTVVRPGPRVLGIYWQAGQVLKPSHLAALGLVEGQGV
jgi:hypothetical protein